MNTLEGKIVLVTGAKGGLGTFVTESFLAAGARVIGVSRSIQAGDSSTRNLPRWPPSYQAARPPES
jgi:NAD(P)-dependent dehydrogenase (short-subunit alcohol dehydrogenase family)